MMLLKWFVLAGLLLSPAVVGAESDADCTFSQVVVGADISCGKRITGGTWGCWGDTTIADTPVPSALSGNTFTKIVAGGNAFCGLKSNGGIVCWCQGRAATSACTPPLEVVTEAPAGTGYKDIAISYPTGCAIKSDNTVECWGAEGYDTEAGACAAVPHYTACCGASRSTITWAGHNSGPSGSYLSISGDGASVFCGIKADTSIDCWGDEGDNTAFFAAIPAGTGWDAVRVSTTPAYACAHKNSDNSLSCWGWEYGTTCNPAVLTGPAATAGAYDETQLVAAAGGACAVALADNKLDCWGPSYLTTGNTFSSSNVVHGLDSQSSLACSLSTYKIPGSQYKLGAPFCFGRQTPSQLFNNTPVCVVHPAATVVNVIQ